MMIARFSHLFMLLTLILASRQIAAKDCLLSLDSIRNNEIKVRDDSVLRTYVLCPNTTFSVADVFGGNMTHRGQYPIIAARSNLHILCGKYGTSEDNCVLSGGLLHVGMYDDFGMRKPLTNVLIQGLTFGTAKAFNVLAEAEGDLTIRDCIFKGNRNGSPVYAGSLRGEEHRRKLTTGDLDAYLNRLRRVDKLSKNLSLKIANSIFLENVVSPSSGASVEGLVTIQAANAILSDCIISGTTLEESVELAYHISVEQGTLIMKKNCFFGNDDRIAPVIISYASATAAETFVQRTSSVMSATNCDFLATIVQGGIDLPYAPQTRFACQSPDAIVCSAETLIKVAPPCLETLAQIHKAEIGISIPKFVRTYILCPQTIYKLEGFTNSSGENPDRSLPIIIGRPNVHVLCGADGSSQNHCQVAGGDVQVAVVDVFSSGGQAASNSVIAGISFVGSTYMNIFVNFASRLVVQDCLFMNNANIASIYIGDDMLPLNVGSSVLFNRLSAENGATKVTVLRSNFMGNLVGTAPQKPQGLITNYNADLRVRDCNFLSTTQRNMIDDQMFKPLLYLVGNFGGSLEVTNNCFVDNHVFAPVVSQGGTTIARLNYGERVPLTENKCAFMATFEKTGSFIDPLYAPRYTRFNCTDFDASACGVQAQPNPVQSDVPKATTATSGFVRGGGTSWLVVVATVIFTFHMVLL